MLATGPQASCGGVPQLERLSTRISYEVALGVLFQDNVAIVPVALQVAVSPVGIPAQAGVAVGSAVEAQIHVYSPTHVPL